MNWVRTLIYPFGCSFFIRPAGWPVGWGWLLPGYGVTRIEFQAHEFNRHQPWVLLVFLPPPRAAPALTAPIFPAGLGAGGGSSPPDAPSAASSPSGVASASAVLAASATVSSWSSNLRLTTLDLVHLYFHSPSRPIEGDQAVVPTPYGRRPPPIPSGWGGLIYGIRCSLEIPWSS